MKIVLWGEFVNIWILWADNLTLIPREDKEQHGETFKNFIMGGVGCLDTYALWLPHSFFCSSNF